MQLRQSAGSVIERAVIGFGFTSGWMQKGARIDGVVDAKAIPIKHSN